MSEDAREFPSSKFVVDSSPGAIRVSGQLDFLVSSLLEEFPSDICFVLVGRGELLEGVETVDSEEVAAFLVSEDVLGEGVLLPGFPEVPGNVLIHLSTSLCLSLYIYMCICMHIYIYIYTYIYICITISVHMRMCV